MKKLLSLILAITMVLSLVPSAFATPAAEFDIDFADVNTEQLSKANANATTQDLVKRDTTVEATDKSWSINTDQTVSTIFEGQSLPVRIYKETFGNTRAQLTLNSTYVENNENVLVMTFEVPSTGWYDVDALVYKSIYGGVGEIYIDGKKECVYDFFKAVGEDGEEDTDAYGRKNETIDITEAPILLTQGTHEIKIVGQKTTRTEKTNTYQYVDICKFIFTPSEAVREVSFVLDSTRLNKAYTALTDEQKPTVTSNGWALKNAASPTLLERTIMRPYGLQIQSDMRESSSYVTLEFGVESSGNYDLALTYFKYYYGGYGNVYIDDKCVGEVNYYAPKDNSSYGNYEELRPIYLSAGTHTLTFAVNRNHETGGYVNMYPSSLMLINKASLSALTSAAMAISDSELEVNETVTPGYTLTYANGAVAEVKTFSGVADETVAISLTSSNPSVVKVENNALVAVGSGTAEISAAVTVNGASVDTNKVTVKVPERNLVSFAQTTNVDGYKNITVQSVTRGDSVALTAHALDIDGYEFVGWKRGADEDNMDTWVDISGDTYNVWTNTYLTAIYKPVGEEVTKTVDFWNQNGTYLGQATEATFAQDVTRVPSLTGFGAFLGWFTDGDVKLTAESVLPAGTTNAVAQYEDGAVSGVTREGETVTEADTYNEAVSLTASKTGFTCWKRDGKIVSYDDTYTYYVWGATDITEGTDVVDKTPVGILEYNEAYNAYMLEYDEGDYKIVEAGILFGGSLTIDSCAKKYTSQRKVSHNQFTAPAGDYESAKGYIIWETDSGAYAVEYIDIAE